MPVSQDLTASGLVALQLNVETMFTGDTPTEYIYRDPAATFGALLERNRAIVVPRLNELQVCTDVEVHALIPDAFTVGKTGGVWDLDCDPPTTRYPESFKKTYATEALAVTSVAVNDNLCANFFLESGAMERDPVGRQRAGTLIARQLEFGMRRLRTLLNAQAITALNGWRTTVDSDGDTGTNILWAGTPNFHYSSAAANFQTPDFLTEIEVIAANTRIQEFFMLSGRNNFYNSVRNADYRVLNDNERFLARYGDYDMAFDLTDLDKNLAQQVTFVIGEGTYIIWNANYAPIEPFQIDEDKWRFTLQDPVLRIFENGSLRPVLYEVVYNRKCQGRDALTNHTYNRIFELKYIGGIEQAPVAPGANTGVLKFVAEPIGA